MGANSTTLVPSQSAVVAYVANFLSTFDAKPEVAYASAAALPANTYANGTLGVGATLTGTANGPLLIDGVTLAVGAVGLRILVTSEAASANNGWYTLTQLGVVAVSPYILTRDPLSDQAAEIEPGYLTAVRAPSGLTGGTQDGKVFMSICAQPFTVGTTALTFSNVGGTGTVTSASVVTANGVSASVANATTTPAFTFTLGAITPTTVNGNTFTTGNYTLTGVAAKTLTFNNSITLAGTDATTMTFPGVSASVGYLNLPETTHNANYTVVKGDAGTCIAHPASDANARTFTIDSVTNQSWDAGTALTFKNETSQVLSIAVTTEALTLAGSTTTGTRSLAQNGIATAHLNAAKTVWLISGPGLT